MIRIVNGAAKERLTGKFVLFDGNNIFASFASAREVVSETDTSITCRSFARKIDEAGAITYSIANEDFDISEHRKTSVRCICDTLAELNHVASVNRDSRALFNAAIAESRKLLAAVDGMELNDHDVTTKADVSKGMAP
jgi:hypothetical protein|nr:hypothetical protein [Neorhizobium tomejilense]